MNKILLVEDINKINDEVYLVEYSKNSKLDISGTTSLSDYDNNYNLDIDVEDGTNLVFDKVNFIDKELVLNINMRDEAILEFNWVIINKGKNKVYLNINMLGNNSKCRAKVRVINVTSDSNVDLICDGVIAANTKDNELIQDLKGLIHNESTIKISPIMKVNTNEVMANHLVTIGSFNKDEMFYLNSKGLSNDIAKKMLINSFVSSILNLELKKLINMEVIKFE